MSPDAHVRLAEGHESGFAAGNVSALDVGISVVVPVFNGARYLADALDSVARQALPPRQVIVVDDESTDESARIARRFEGVLCVTQAHAGAAVARNRGAALSSEAHLAFLDADDVWLPSTLEVLARALMASGAEMASGALEAFVSPELSPVEAARFVTPVGVHPAHAPGTMLISRAAFERVGPFAPHLRVGEFVDWYVRARDGGVREVTVPALCLRRRIHGRNTSLHRAGAEADYVTLVKDALRRRRSDPGPGA